MYLICFRYLATGDSYASLHMLFRVGRSTIPKIVNATCIALKTILAPSCLPALSKERLASIADGFERRTTYPHIVGAIDGKTIAALC